MGRINKFTTGVFTNIVGDKKTIPDYDRFLAIQTQLKEPSDYLKGYIETYKATIRKNKSSVDNLGKLEDVIMQLRTLENLDTKDIRLNVVREYIYARIPFHRKDKETKDIRVIVGVTEEWGTKIPKLLGNKKFMTAAKEKLSLAMNEVIEESREIAKSAF